MAGYKIPCIACGGLIQHDSNTCPLCGRRSPFTDRCPACLCKVEKGWTRCPSCGRALLAVCPHCGQQTFVGDTCQACGKPLLIQCKNKRCGAKQFFENAICTQCGKTLKDRTIVY